MTIFVICKNCKEKIFTNRPTGNVQASGNVQYSGVQLDGNSIKFNSGGSLNFGQGGKISFGNPANSKIRCPNCGAELIYDISEFKEN